MSDQEPAELDADVQLEPSEAGQTGAEGAPGPAVFIMETALAEINRHAAEEPQHEIGGILVGSVVDGARPVVLVEAAIRGHAMAHTRGSVTFTHETWNEINSVKDSQYPDLKIVGWYHSHPGFGLFLSGHDLFIHQNFFTAPWQVAVVVDPLAKSWGCFTWHGKELVQDGTVHEVAVQWASAEPAVPAIAPAAPAAAPAPIIIPAPAAPPSNRGVTWAMGLIGLLLAILIGLTLSAYNDVRILKGQTVTMGQQLGNVQHELTALRDRILDLGDTPAPPASPAASTAAEPRSPDSPTASPTPATASPPPAERTAP